MNGTERPLPGRFFSEREINEKFGIHSAESLWKWIADGAMVPHREGSGASAGGSALVFYRGQPSADYPLTSSLFRALWSNNPNVSEKLMQDAERQLLTVLRNMEGLGRLMTDGELLAVLQHHGIPTRLIDVSARPLEALFFAVDRAEDMDGRLFLIELPAKNGDGPDTIDLRSQQELEWKDAALGEPYSRSHWTERVAVVDPQDLDPRMRAQRGRFLVGGLSASYPGRIMRFEGKRLAAKEMREITSLNIFFPQGSALGRNWSATAWTVRIEAGWKRQLRSLLKAQDDKITMDTMYPPIGEVRRLALREIGIVARTLHVSKGG
ncbi:FRG domain-containing protein [Kitasatospora sp. NPDC004240]